MKVCKRIEVNSVTVGAQVSSAMICMKTDDSELSSVLSVSQREHSPARHRLRSRSENGISSILDGGFFRAATARLIQVDLILTSNDGCLDRTYEMCVCSGCLKTKKQKKY